MIQSTSVEKALKIIRCFNEKNKDLSLNDLNLKLGISKPTLYRLCYILVKEGFLSKNKEMNTYRLGVNMLEIANSYINTSNFVSSVDNILEELSKEFGETVTIYKRDGFYRKCIMRFEAEYALRYAVQVGERLPLDKGAAGKTILSFFEEDERYRYYEYIGTDKIEQEKFEEALNNIKTNGYYVSYGERDKFLASAAVPLFGNGKKIFGALGVSGPIQRFSEKIDKENLNSLIKYGYILNNLVKHFE
ncbi:IclR family transcriptional regulator [Flexistipes sinusarabici]|uniref:IclR family transcriptional regulator n=1 Tax=Flexistipes sinusarabici TaxID=2352 RepID=UPI002352D344|nr:IclR family transcriptional regulator [Flexistipes sinusarabici]